MDVYVVVKGWGAVGGRDSRVIPPTTNSVKYKYCDLQQQSEFSGFTTFLGFPDIFIRNERFGISLRTNMIVFTFNFKDFHVHPN